MHGTHGVTVEDNVAYNTFGHCYFLEDGGEKNNTFHHNLGLLTQFGTTIPSDRMPATFWVTSPLNFLTENSAAGSQGMGIWYIFADKVTVDLYNKYFSTCESPFTLILLLLSYSKMEYLAMQNWSNYREKYDTHVNSNFVNIDI